MIRGLLGGEQARNRARELVEGRSQLWAPDLLYADVVQSLVKYVRAGELSALEAGELLGYVGDLPLDPVPCAELADDALGLALERGVSGYDAMYLALADATDAVLVTADRRLAAATTRSELVG